MPDFQTLDEGALKATWWRFQALFFQYQGDYAQAEEAFEQAHAVCPASALEYGHLRLSQGALYGQLGQVDEAISAYYDARISFKEHKRPQDLLVASYNLGWNMTQRLHLNDAAQTFEEVLLLAERLSPREYAPLLTLGRAYVWLLTGEYERASGAVAWAAGRTDVPDIKARALLLLVQLDWLTGQTQRARQRLSDVDPLSPHISRIIKQQHKLLQGILDQDPELLRAAATEPGKNVQIRAQLHLASLSLRDNNVDEVNRLLSDVTSKRPTPYQWQQDQVFLPQLYAFGQRNGFPLPSPLFAASRQAVLKLGGQQLTVGDRAIAATLTEDTAAVIAYLAECGERPRQRLNEYVLGTADSKRLSRALRQLRVLFGTPECVLEERDLLRLNSAWQWRVDHQGAEPAFTRLDTPFTRELSN